MAAMQEAGVWISLGPLFKENYMETGGTFDWTLFDNSNQSSFVQLPSKVGMFKSDLVRLIRPKNQVEQNITQT